MRVLALIVGALLTVAGAVVFLFGTITAIGALNLNPEALRGGYISAGISFGVGGLVLGAVGAMVAYLSRAPSQG